MIDKELIRFLEDKLNEAWHKGRVFTGIDLSEEASIIEEFIERLGYRKVGSTSSLQVRGKPPLLSDREIVRLYGVETSNLDLQRAKTISEAQRKLDVRFYNG